MDLHNLNLRVNLQNGICSLENFMWKKFGEAVKGFIIGCLAGLLVSSSVGELINYSYTNKEMFAITILVGLLSSCIFVIAKTK